MLPLSEMSHKVPTPWLVWILVSLWIPMLAQLLPCFGITGLLLALELSSLPLPSRSLL